MDSIQQIISKFLNLGIVSIALSVLLYDKFDFPHRDIVVSIVIIVIVLFLVFMILYYAIRCALYEIKVRTQSIIGERMEYTCQFINNKGTLGDTVRYRLRNISTIPLMKVFVDSEGFAKNINFVPNYYFEERSKLPDGKIKVIGNNVSLSEYPEISSGIKIYQGLWGVTIEPPLQPSESVIFARSSIDDVVEDRAFAPEGTDFIFASTIPFRSLYIVIHAPPGYKISKAKRTVVSQSGKEIVFGNNRGSFAEINRNTMIWKISYSNPSLRYKIHFSLEEVSNAG